MAATSVSTPATPPTTPPAMAPTLDAFRVEFEGPDDPLVVVDVEFPEELLVGPRLRQFQLELMS